MCLTTGKRSVNTPLCQPVRTVARKTDPRLHLALGHFIMQSRCLHMKPFIIIRPPIGRAANDHSHCSSRLGQAFRNSCAYSTPSFMGLFIRALLCLSAVWRLFTSHRARLVLATTGACAPSVCNYNLIPKLCRCSCSDAFVRRMGTSLLVSAITRLMMASLSRDHKTDEG
jgi:hypothetical protein